MYRYGVSSEGASQRPVVAVVGLWHLGVVIAACLAEAGVEVVATDPDPSVITMLRDDHPPVEEPGLGALLHTTRTSRWLTFAHPPSGSLGHAKIVWIAFDTPVDDDDHADADFVLRQACAALTGAVAGALVVVSSQLPVGSVAALERRMAASGRDDLRFACVPENLRLGRALETFSSPERFVAGVRSSEDAAQLAPLLDRFGARVEWMRVESAEMTKHALNGFLATSVAFINEISGICEKVGADASDVARGLKSERRIGPDAYLEPGDAFAGGTLGRDVSFLNELAHSHGLPGELVAGVAQSNATHHGWSRRALTALLGKGGENGDRVLAGRRIAVWGLTYKPGTNTLRRSSALELCRWLRAARASVRAYDPAIGALPADAAAAVELMDSPLAAVEGADALIVCTPWPQFRSVPVEDVVALMARPIALDPGGHLRHTLGEATSVRYARVGLLPR